MLASIWNNQDLCSCSNQNYTFSIFFLLCWALMHILLYYNMLQNILPYIIIESKLLHVSLEIYVCVCVCVCVSWAALGTIQGVQMNPLSWPKEKKIMMSNFSTWCAGLWLVRDYFGSGAGVKCVFYASQSWLDTLVE